MRRTLIRDSPLFVLLGLAAAWVLVELQWAHALHWDELEFFRATRWIGEGRLPFRDFWEHHTPLQWLIFAPVTRFFVRGAGTASVVAMRWAQLPLWVAGLAMLRLLILRVGASSRAAWLTVLMLLTSRVFILYGVEYRVDTLGNVCYLGAFVLAMGRPASARTWAIAGALMSCAVLSNMRMAPLVIVTGALWLIVRPEQRIWGFNRQATAMIGGLAVVLAIVAVSVVSTGATDGVLEGLIRYNRISDRLMAVDRQSLVTTLLLPLRWRDVSTIVLALGAVVGGAMALREIRRPGPLQVLTLLTIVAFLASLQLGVHYPYHFQTSLLLGAILAAMALAPFELPAVTVVVVALAVDTVSLLGQPLGAAMEYQDRVMRAVHNRTNSGEVVWDGCGYALWRTPAYRYWFLPAGVRLMAQSHLIPAYDARALLARPPAAVIVNDRILSWLAAFPDLVPILTSEYLPIYRNLWIPAPSGIVDASRPTEVWTVLRAGRYRLWASPLLAKHPWFRDPLQYSRLGGPASEELEAPLAMLPPADPTQLRWSVNGHDTTAALLDLEPGDRVCVTTSGTTPLGIVVVPEDVKTLFVGPSTLDPF